MKKTLALLLAVLMMVSVIPFAAAAECEHINTVDWFVADGNGNHSNKKCSDCGEVLGSVKCTASGAVAGGVCDWCGTTIPAPAPTPDPEPCKHTNTVDWFVADGYGKHSTKKCSDCGDLLGSEKCSSSGAITGDTNKEVCDWCGTKIPEVIEPSKPSTKPNTGYNYSKNYHWVELNGVIIPGTKDTHTFNRTNGKCKYCGYYNKNYDNDYKYGYGDYRVYVSDSGKGDTDVSTYYADAGDRVYIYTDPDFGYLLVDIEVETKNGREIKVTKSSNGKYSFKMPSSNVYVQVAYSNGNKDIDYGYNYFGSYTDVDSNAWYASAVKYVTNYEIMEGKSYNKFAPNSNMTRAALAEALYAIAGAKASGTENFSDVDRYDDYYEAVVWCAKKDIIEGWNGKFSPNGDITREDFAVMMYRFAKVERMSTKASEDLDQFTDADNVSDYAVEALEWAVAEGLINGMGDGTLAPQGTTTRAQAAAILMRLCKNVK